MEGAGGTVVSTSTQGTTRSPTPGSPIGRLAPESPTAPRVFWTEPINHSDVG
jgi:hypothetical protein